MVQNELLEMNNVGVIVEEKRYNRRKSRVELAKSKCGGLCDIKQTLCTKWENGPNLRGVICILPFKIID